MYHDAKQCAGALNFFIERRGSGDVDRLMSLADPAELFEEYGRIREVVELGEPYRSDSPVSVRARKN
jgi:hypothetical protein